MTGDPFFHATALLPILALSPRKQGPERKDAVIERSLGLGF